MLALRTKAQVVSPTARVLKVAGLVEFASGNWPVEKMLLDCRDPAVASRASELADLPWGGAIDPPCKFTQTAALVTDIRDEGVIRPGDVTKLDSSGAILNLYRRTSRSNFLFATERCNNLCLMCSQPPRNIEDGWRLNEMFETVSLIDAEIESLGITGGEPTLLGEGLAELLAFCGAELPNTGFHVLTNGRKFAEAAFVSHFRESAGRVTWAVPVYGDGAALHDYVVQARGAFAETTRGIYGLAQQQQLIEIRVVLQRATAERLLETAEFIARSFPFTHHVALMGLEPIGFSLANRDSLWVDPADYVADLAGAIEILERSGLAVSIYNLPLCVLPRHLWPRARQSISEWKQTYQPVCQTCSVRESCGGFFASNRPEWQSRSVHAIA